MNSKLRIAAAAVIGFLATARRPARCDETPASPSSVNAAKAGIQWLRIPGGSFMMGSAEKNSLALPAHRVTIKSFQMAKTLVTNKQYKACMDAGYCSAPGDFGPGFKSDDRPVVSVDWHQARAFSLWAGGRLPSEAEWEYAARGAGKDQKYPWGDEEATCRRAVTSGCSVEAEPVCSRPAGNTKQGLCDMAGNAYEWVEDSAHDGYVGAPMDGSAWKDANPGRIARGGSWRATAEHAQSNRRQSYRPSHRYQCLGFRPAR